MTSTAELSSPASADIALTTSSIGVGAVDVDYTLEDKFTRTNGRIYLSGVQALVRLPLMQKLRDERAGLNTAGFVSGYRGSPLGGFDLELWLAACWRWPRTTTTAAAPPCRMAASTSSSAR